jgi:hypothetical protein
MNNLSLDIKKITSMIEDFIHLSEQEQNEIRQTILTKRLISEGRRKYKTDEEVIHNLKESIALAKEINSLNEVQRKKLYEEAKKIGINFGQSKDIEEIEVIIKLKELP